MKYFLVLLFCFKTFGEAAIQEDKTYRVKFSNGKNVEQLALIHPDGKVEFPTNEPKKAFEYLWKLYQESGCQNRPLTGTTSYIYRQ